MKNEDANQQIDYRRFIHYLIAEKWGNIITYIILKELTYEKKNKKA